jgi:GT2 family glycosyltransferase
MDIVVSVVIPTFKRRLLLERCLNALLLQTMDPAAYEIIIADDEPSLETKRLVEAYAGRTFLPVIRYCAVQGSHGPAAARNQGWQAAAGELIAFTDDDCIPEPDWLARGISAFTPDVAGISGRVIVPVGSGPTDHERNSSFLEEAEFVTANCMYRKRILADVGGFDERFTAAWREDADLFFSLLKRGERLLSVSDAIVIHPVRNAHWGSSIREQSKSIFNALLYKKHPDIYRQKIRSSALPYYYGIVASALVSMLALLGGLRSTALIAVFIWALLTGALCFKRLRGTSRAPGHVLEMAVTSAVIPFLSVFWRVTGAVKFRVFFY